MLHRIMAAAVFTILAVLIVVLIYRQKNLQIIEKKNRELQAEALRADQASEAKSQFLSSMHHNLSVTSRLKENVFPAFLRYSFGVQPISSRNVFPK